MKLLHCKTVVSAIKQLWNVKTDSTFILYTYEHTSAHTHTTFYITKAKYRQLASVLRMHLCQHQGFIVMIAIWQIHTMDNFYLMVYRPPLISSTAYSFRVGIWPPPQRAPAPAVVLTDKSAHHEPEEWGRGGTTTYSPPGFRWVVQSSH